MCSAGAGTPQKCCVKSRQYIRPDLIEWYNRCAAAAPGSMYNEIVV